MSLLSMKDAIGDFYIQNLSGVTRRWIPENLIGG